ncbi:MAG: FIG187021: hypothetical protein, partial [uncultured Actinomycetospora sp.]
VRYGPAGRHHGRRRDDVGLVGLGLRVGLRVGHRCADQPAVARPARPAAPRGRGREPSRALRRGRPRDGASAYRQGPAAGEPAGAPLRPVVGAQARARARRRPVLRVDVRGRRALRGARRHGRVGAAQRHLPGPHLRRRRWWRAHHRGRGVRRRRGHRRREHHPVHRAGQRLGVHLQHLGRRRGRHRGDPLRARV